jgi:hypothetical protein
MASSCNSLNVQTIKVSQLAVPSRDILSTDFFAMIESGSSLYSRRATFGNLLTFVGSANGNYSGSFSGSFQGNFTQGKVTGSFLGNLKGNVTGTASWASNTVLAKTASYVSGYPSGSGTTDYTTYWVDSDTVGANDYIIRNTTRTAAGGGSAGYWPSSTGRTLLNRPLDTNSQVGQHLIQFSSSGGGINYMYDVGLQPGSSYIRTGANFAIYYSGSYTSATSLASPSEKDCFWRPDVAAKSGIYGWTSFGVRGRLVGIGHFPQSNNIQAQCHVHLSGSFGWPTYYANNAGSTNTYRPNENVLLVTSGSSYTKLLRVSGSGQMDVRGDIVAYSTFATSDARLKEDIAPIEDAYTKLASLNPVSFVWAQTDQADYGLIAQEVEEIFPEFVKDNMDGYKTVKYTSFIPLLIKTIQEQQQLIESLQDRVSTLEED